jgi:hypothetical protein
VLFDLNGYTTHSKSEIFVLRPAPVQISWLGYLGTLGAGIVYVIDVSNPAAPAIVRSVFFIRSLLSAKV